MARHDHRPRWATALLAVAGITSCTGESAEVVEANKAVVRRYLEEVFNTGDVDRLPEIVSPEYVEVHENTAYPLGLEGARDHVLGVRAAFPDMHITIEQQIGEGEWVASRITVRGTHLGEWLGMTPTGKQLTFTGVNLNRVVDGLVVEHGGAANLFPTLLGAGSIAIVPASED